MATPFYCGSRPSSVHLLGHALSNASQKAACTIESLTRHLALSVLLQLRPILLSVLMEASIHVEAASHGSRLRKHGCVVVQVRGRNGIGVQT